MARLRLGSRLRPGRALLLGVAATVTVGSLAMSSAAAAPSTPAAKAATLRGTTAVTTAPGIAGTLLGAGILPLPVPPTGVRLGFASGLQVTYAFPITGGNPDLTTATGDILHSGGINFVGLRGRLEIGKFDIDLAAGKVFATQVDFAPARIPVLDLDLSALKVSTSGGATVLSGIGLRLDPVAAGALDSTFHISLPTDGSLVFGSATVTLRS